jgi:hypothetical protein
MIFFPCPACSIRVPAASQHVGRLVPCPTCNRPVAVPDPDLSDEPDQDTVPVECNDRPTRSAEAIFTHRPLIQPKTNWLVVGCLATATVVALITFLQSHTRN